jgi:hypothetical protein
MTAAMAAGALGLLVPGLARAHFTLNSPMNWAQQGSLGVPEKSAPCGQADPGTTAVPTNVVTTYRPGQTIMVSITEDVPHPGWYRAVLSQNGMNGLPADPMVTPTTGANGSACGTATAATDTIVGLTPQPPGGPLLVDGALRHTGNLNGVQMFPVTLPSNVTCTNCVLQIVEFMSNHGLNNPGGCFYHHCANIAIQGTPVDGGMSGGGDAGSDAKAGTGGNPGTGGSSAGVGGSTGGGVAGMSGGVAGMTGGGVAGMTGGGTAGMSGGTAGMSGGGTAGMNGGSTAGTSGGNGTGGSKNNDSSSGGCSIASGASGSAGGLFGLLLAMVLIKRRRRG